MKNTNTRNNHAWALLAPLALGCSALEPDEFPEAADRLAPARDGDRSLEEIADIADDDIIINYREGEATMEIVVDVASRLAYTGDLTVEFGIEAKLPSGAIEDHDVVWSPDEDQRSPSITVPMEGLGRYEVVVTDLAVEGNPIAEGVIARAHMTLYDGELIAKPPATAACGAGATINGNNNPNTKHGTNHNDTIRLMGGNDTGYGYGCNDTIYGGTGKDVLFGGEGNDVLYGKGGDDTLVGGGGLGDICVGNGGWDHFSSCESAYQ